MTRWLCWGLAALLFTTALDSAQALAIPPHASPAEIKTADNATKCGGGRLIRVSVGGRSVPDARASGRDCRQSQIPIAGQRGRKEDG